MSLSHHYELSYVVYANELLSVLVAYVHQANFMTERCENDIMNIGFRFCLLIRVVVKFLVTHQCVTSHSLRSAGLDSYMQQEQQ